MRVAVELSAEDIRYAIANYVGKKSGVTPDQSQVRVQVKSKQNYKAEWEDADYRAYFTANEKEPVY